jgi:hypothetical protein
LLPGLLFLVYRAALCTPSLYSPRALAPPKLPLHSAILTLDLFPSSFPLTLVIYLHSHLPRPYCDSPPPGRIRHTLCSACWYGSRFRSFHSQVLVIYKKSTMLINGEKWACEACVRGHRVSNCQHSGERSLRALLFSKRSPPLLQRSVRTEPGSTSSSVACRRWRIGGSSSRIELYASLTRFHLYQRRGARFLDLHTHPNPSCFWHQSSRTLSIKSIAMNSNRNKLTRANW